MKKSLLSFQTLNSIIEGILLALIPGLHPMLLGWKEPFLLGVLYGSFTGAAIYLSKHHIYHPDTAGGKGVALVEVLKGVILAILLIPLALVLYSVEIPFSLVFLILFLMSLPLMKYPSFLLSGILGVIALRMSVDVYAPLASGLFYLFASKAILQPFPLERKEDTVRGVLSGFLTGYVPALPPSLWASLLRGGSIGVGAAVAPIFSLVALLYGKTRSAMSAFISYPYPEIIILVGLSYIVALILVLSLFNIAEIPSLPKEVTIGVLIAHAVWSGIPNLLLLILSVAAILISKEDPPSALFGFLIIPTLVYYS